MNIEKYKLSWIKHKELLKNMILRLKKIYKSVIVLSVIGTIISCQNANKSNNSNENQQNINVQWDKVETKYAKKFDIKYYDDLGYKELNIIEPFSGSKDTLTYILKESGAQVPTEVKNKAISVIDIPIKSAASLSNAHLAYFDRLGTLPFLTAVSDTAFISNPLVKEMIAQKQITDLGSSNQPNKEVMLTVQPKLVTYTIYSAAQLGTGSEYKNLGINYVPIAEWQENTPLGRAEWIKFFACFFNKEKEANEVFDLVEENYLKSKEIAAEVTNRPKVLTGLSYQGAWHVPNENSYIATLLSDAGADLPWENNKGTASTPMAFEVVYEKGHKCDYWINISSIRNKKELIQTDHRFNDFLAVKDNHLFNNNKRLNALGWNEYYETSTMSPDIVLKDLIKIFHPDLIKEHELYYYQTLE
ncbi:ABC transporter substrate-binding protein [Sediminitomix flava]|uniref:Iron complex transport system substrate-binding protein n=1 Tax=Sediminitomix flava TaxID=379075 RepID=A0A315ZH36_SEDFL|nr:ABC transporter substrate-binding protein [Sediminitomix flava]PWJ44489.1 iron complex transport system substrate-binding protein [Sediminitomix flava]